jgi:molybdenum cofactor biosynthesis enzyme MoaA
MADRAQAARLDALYEATLRPLVAGAGTVKVTGSGDPFGSRHFRRVLADLAAAKDGPRIQLHTNGVLADEAAWEELGLWGRVASVWVSIDSTRPATYEALRGGDFPRLLANLEFLGTLRRAGELRWLRLDMVVQRDNYDEMGELAEMAARIGADGIYLLRLRNWGTFMLEEFRALDVCDPGHPEHAAFRDRLRDPRLAAPGVDLGSLAPFARPRHEAAPP